LLTIGRAFILAIMNSITRILDDVEKGKPGAAAELLPLVYNELRQLAAARLAQEKPGHTLQATALVHEAYLRLIPGDERDSPVWGGRGHFFAAAAEAMRRILVESARKRKTEKHGGGWQRRDASQVSIAAPETPEELVALDEALDKLTQLDPLKAELVKLRYFAGLTIEQAAAALNISPPSAKRYWAYSRAWLFQAITGS
jgi:RNA polymerase sigma factor (TIGR02999 family)